VDIVALGRDARQARGRDVRDTRRQAVFDAKTGLSRDISTYWNLPAAH
jgi:hypothetical protein